MSRIASPPEKNRVAYKRDHYNDNRESDTAWRNPSRSKRLKARRAFCKASNDFLRICGAGLETAPVSAERK